LVSCATYASSYPGKLFWLREVAMAVEHVVRVLAWNRREDGFVPKKKFNRIVEDFPKYGRFEITGRDDQGFLLFNCNWVTSEGICRDYENRLPLCRAFPETSLVFAGGKLPQNCGYNFSEVVSFEKILTREMKKKK
jgi:hypothetical protein